MTKNLLSNFSFESGNASHVKAGTLQKWKRLTKNAFNNESFLTLFRYPNAFIIEDYTYIYHTVFFFLRLSVFQWLLSVCIQSIKYQRYGDLENLLQQGNMKVVTIPTILSKPGNMAAVKERITEQLKKETISNLKYYMGGVR